MRKALIFPLLFSFLLSFGQNILIEPNGIRPNRANGFVTKSYEEILSLSQPEMGEAYFDTTSKKVRVFDGEEWGLLQSAGSNEFQGSFFSPELDTASGFGIRKMLYGKNGKYYLCGTFRGRVSFNSGTIFSPGNGVSFVLVLNKNFELEWCQTTQGGSSFINDISINDNGEVFINGIYWQNTVFAGINLIEKNPYSDTFLAKFDPSGNLVTLKVITDSSNGYTIQAMNANDNGLYICGLKGPNGNSNSFYGLFDFNTEAFLWENVFNGEASPRAIVFSESDVFLAGTFDGPVTLGSLNFNGTNAIFLVKAGALQGEPIAAKTLEEGINNIFNCLSAHGNKIYLSNKIFYFEESLSPVGYNKIREIENDSSNLLPLVWQDSIRGSSASINYIDAEGGFVLGNINIGVLNYNQENSLTARNNGELFLMKFSKSANSSNGKRFYWAERLYGSLMWPAGLIDQKNTPVLSATYFKKVIKGKEVLINNLFDQDTNSFIMKIDK